MQLQASLHSFGLEIFFAFDLYIAYKCRNRYSALVSQMCSRLAPRQAHSIFLIGNWNFHLRP